MEQFELDVDIYAEEPDQPSEFKCTVFYGQVEYFLEFTLEPISFHGRGEDIKNPTRLVLALVTPCKTSGVDGAIKLALYAMGAAGIEPKCFISLKSVECMVGRARRARRWYIVDRSQQLMRTVFVDEEDD